MFSVFGVCHVVAESFKLWMAEGVKHTKAKEVLWGKIQNNDVANIVIDMERRCRNDNMPKIRSRICAVRLVNKSPGPCPPYSHSPAPADKRVVRVCWRSPEITLAASFQGGRGRHGYSIHETSFEEMWFGRQKIDPIKNMFCSMFEATPTLMSETY